MCYAGGTEDLNIGDGAVSRLPACWYQGLRGHFRKSNPGLCNSLLRVCLKASQLSSMLFYKAVVLKVGLFSFHLAC